LVKGGIVADKLLSCRETLGGGCCHFGPSICGWFGRCFTCVVRTKEVGG
jgi:hypothetical protein